MYYYGNSDVGKKRANNQDSFTVKQYKCGAVLGVVCDGMGGAHGGETASSTALKTFTDSVGNLMKGITKGGKKPADRRIAEALVDAVSKANIEVFTKASEDEGLEGMGTTLVSSLVFDDRIFTVNIGDSRMYLVDLDKIVQVTHDHSYVQYLVDIGKMTEDEAASSRNKNIITRAIGTEAETEPDVYLTEIKRSSDSDNIHILLCTDGLTNHVDKETILGIINSEPADGEDSCRKIVDSLIDAANRNGGSDNITAVLISL